VLVAGSNGKGSTSALLAAMARAAGYRTGLYTSPHLEAVEERMRIDGRVIASERLGLLLEQVVQTGEQRLGYTPTYFEAVTVAAFLWFAAEHVELAVVEVGLGGRLDATNLCEPVISLITAISLEHREHLGETLGAIAREKAGILRPGRPALTWIEEPAAAAAVAAVAAEVGAEEHDAAAEVAIGEAAMRGWQGQRVSLATPRRGYQVELALLGAHQVKNLGLAVRAAEVLAEHGFPRFDAAAVTAGAASCRWPGRLEVVELPEQRRALLDAAHNSGGAEVLGAFLEATLTAPADLLFGVLADKDAGDMLARLAAPPWLRQMVLTSPPSGRARPPAELAAMVAAGRPPLIEPDLGRALTRVLDLGAETVVACGSIYLVGEVRRLLRQRYGVPPAADLPEPAVHVTSEGRRAESARTAP
jgi:dihydrofolate synthase/folylpolyglutamate synthase